ncbi:MAG: glycerate kinase, partial [Oscillospiraceae bacterium]|nr:glycerate kinase [Oscillospiraceae bacterium]
VRFTDKDGNDAAPTPAGIKDIAEMDVSGLDPRLASTDIIVACDVSNKLLGAEGASAVFGPQKGADPETVKVLEGLLEKYADIIENHVERDIRSIKGTGAAGGIGVSLLAFCKAEMRQGIDVVMEAVRFEELLEGADLVITGEGRIDEQSIIGGKVPVGIAGRAKAAGIPAAVLAGIIGKNLSGLEGTGIKAVFPTNTHGLPFEEACKTCEKDLLFVTESLMNAVKIGMEMK